MPRRQPGTAAPVDTDALLALDNQFCFALHSASRLVVRAYRPALEALDLTYSQYLVMLVLWEWSRTRHPHPSVSELGARLDLDSGTLTPLLRRLEQKGLLARERSRDDERELFVWLTPEGQAMKQRARKVPLSLLRQSVIPLQEMVKLREQLKRLRAAMLNQSSDDHIA
jgi:DNA-binding MarR family transcriptional regulator